MYQKYYNNVVSIDALKSKWYVQDLAIKSIQDNIKARMNFARDYVYREKSNERPCAMQDMHTDRHLFKNSLS